MKTLFRILVVVVFSVMGISLAHYKLKSDALEIQLKEQTKKYDLLSSAYKLKQIQRTK